MDESDALAQSKPSEVREWIRQNNLVYGGLIGIGTIVIQPFLTDRPTEPAAVVCVIAFAVAIPLLAALILISQQETFRGRGSNSRLVDAAKGIALLAAITGLVAGFWHMSWVAGLLVLISTIVAMIVYAIGYQRVEPKGRWLGLRRNRPES